MTKASDSPNKMTAKEHAAMTLKVPTSGTDWLDEMIRQARQLDSEQFAAKLAEPQGSVAFPDTSIPEVNAEGRAKRTPSTSDVGTAPKGSGR